MKDTFLKLLLPLIATFAAGAAAWLADKGIITADQAASTSAEIQNALNGLAALAAGLLVLVVTWGYSKFFGRKTDGGDTKSTGRSGGNVLSFLLLTAACSMAGVMLPSCGPLSFGPDRCLTYQVQRGGMTYKAGACLGLDGKIDRTKLEWTDSTGREGRAYIYRDSRPAVVEYKTESGLWLKWTEGSGITFEQMPPELVTALENQAPLPAVEASSAK